MVVTTEERKNGMSNPTKWRAKRRTTKPNSRQKRNGLFLDAHQQCQRCGKRKAAEAHHMLSHGHPDRYDWEHMLALCVSCHVAMHQDLSVTITVAFTRAA